MSYYLCPRCQFQVAAKKNVCTTCGFDMLALKNAQPKAGDEQNAKPSVWERMFGSDKRKEAGSEKPALS
jgi:hypothetical protein